MAPLWPNHLADAGPTVACHQSVMAGTTNSQVELKISGGGCPGTHRRTMDGFTQRKRPQGSDGDYAFADDAAYEATGSDRGSTTGDFKAAG